MKKKSSPHPYSFKSQPLQAYMLKDICMLAHIKLTFLKMQGGREGLNGNYVMREGGVQSKNINWGRGSYTVLL